MKTGTQIQTDIYGFLKGSTLIGSLSGGLYRHGLRPRDSQSEDCTVIFTTADAKQIQEGVVTINIFVPDIFPYPTGVPVVNIARCEEIEGLLQEWVDDMTAERSSYLFELKDAIHTQHDDSINQAFVVARLSFRYFES